MLKWIGVVGLLVAACDRGPSASAGPDCSAAVAGVMAAFTSKDAGSAAQQVKPALVASCTTDKWSAEARSCIAKATTKDAQRECWYQHLTGEQTDKLKKASSPLSTSGRAAMKKFHEFADKMCACKDMKCAQEVSDEMTRWSQEMAQMQEEPPTMTEEETKEAQALGERMGKCMQTAMGAGDPPVPEVEPPHDRDTTRDKPGAR
ncbi:MAG TPA: hypothetical protein VLB44_08900 [Kofleriaceae bacterium]|nr:hypothetical protein [Kofleriaceae bacterium]